jgi:hypothetical protein
MNVFEVIGRWLLGIAEWFELIIEKLYEPTYPGFPARWT